MFQLFLLNICIPKIRTHKQTIYKVYGISTNISKTLRMAGQMQYIPVWIKAYFSCDSQLHKNMEILKTNFYFLDTHTHMH